MAKNMVFLTPENSILVVDMDEIIGAIFSKAHVTGRRLILLTDGGDRLTIDYDNHIQTIKNFFSIQDIK